MIHVSDRLNQDLIEVIKALRASVTGLGLKEAKDIVQAMVAKDRKIRMHYDTHVPDTLRTAYPGITAYQSGQVAEFFAKGCIVAEPLNTSELSRTNAALRADVAHLQNILNESSRDITALVAECAELRENIQAEHDIGAEHLEDRQRANQRYDEIMEIQRHTGAELERCKEYVRTLIQEHEAALRTIEMQQELINHLANRQERLDRAKIAAIHDNVFGG